MQNCGKKFKTIVFMIKTNSETQHSKTSMTHEKEESNKNGSIILYTLNA